MFNEKAKDGTPIVGNDINTLGWMAVHQANLKADQVTIVKEQNERIAALEKENENLKLQLKAQKEAKPAQNPSALFYNNPFEYNPFSETEQEVSKGLEAKPN